MSPDNVKHSADSDRSSTSTLFANRYAVERSLEDLLAEYDTPRAVFEGQFDITVDTLFDALAHPGRRYVLTYLLLKDESVLTAELVDFIVELESDPVEPELREQIADELVLIHLPRLSQADLIRYHSDRQVIDTTDNTVAVLPYLQLAAEQEHGTNSDT